VGYVHSVAEVKVGGVTLRVATDSGPDVGLQVLSAGTRRVEIRFVKEVAYLKGNRGGLEELLGADASSAKKYANKWISLTVADGGYAEISSALTMESLIETITLSGDMSKTDVTTIGDREVIGVNGEQGTGGTGTLYVATKGPALLIRLDGRVETQKGTVEFSRWGRHFKVEAPSGAVRAFDLE
jgi:hypothetical protein